MSNLVAAIDTELSALPIDVTIEILDDEDGLVDEVVPDSTGALIAGETRTFETTLYWDGGPVSDESIDFDLVFDTGTVSIVVPEPGPAASAFFALLTVLALRRQSFPTQEAAA